MRGLGRWFSVIYSQEELLFEKLSEGVCGGRSGLVLGGRSESRALRKHITLLYGRGALQLLAELEFSLNSPSLLQNSFTVEWLWIV